MAKSPRKSDVVVSAADRSPKSPRRATVTDRDIARRAYDLYLARAGVHGHDVDDWLQAERELQQTMSTRID